MSWYILFILQLVLIFLTSRYVMQRIFQTIRMITKSTSVSFYLLSLLYLPGTILHELSHLITSVLLFVMPHKFDLIPEVSETADGKYHVRMGAVHHEATDPFRGMLIGTAPILYGLAFFYLVFEFNLFPNEVWWVNIILIYLFFAISSSMFSSKQDMKESLILIPLFLLIISGFIGFGVDLESLFLTPKALLLMERFNLYIAAATIPNTLGALILMKFR